MPFGGIKNRDADRELESSVQYSSFLTVIGCVKEKMEANQFDSIIFVKDLKEVYDLFSSYS